MEINKVNEESKRLRKKYNILNLKGSYLVIK